MATKKRHLRPRLPASTEPGVKNLIGQQPFTSKEPSFEFNEEQPNRIEPTETMPPFERQKPRKGRGSGDKPVAEKFKGERKPK